MIISNVAYKTFGKTTIESNDISELFTRYGDIFKQTFDLTDKSFKKYINSKSTEEVFCCN